MSVAAAGEEYGYIVVMGRHRKPRSERKESDLRIPVTTGQKATVLQAAKLAGVDMATWARPVLLQAAQEAIRKMGEGGQAGT